MEDFSVFLDRKQQISNQYEENLSHLCKSVIVPTIEKYYKLYLVKDWKPYIQYNTERQHKCAVCSKHNKFELGPLGEKIEHVCTERCRGCEFDILDVKAYYTTDGKIHVCVEGICKKACTETHREQIDTGDYLSHVYVCKTSCAIHLCGLGICDRVHQTKDGHQICELTGLGEIGVDVEKHLSIPTNDSSFARNKYGDFFESASDRLGATILQNDFNSNTMTLELERRNERKRDSYFLNKGKGKGARSYTEGSLKQEYVEHAINKTAALLNLDQYEERMNKDAQGYEEAGAKLDSYTNACNKNGSALSAYDMMLTLIATRRTHQSRPHIMMNKALFSQFVRQTAINCLKFWAIIRMKTDLGKNRPNLFPFSDFIEASLCLFGRGVFVPGADGKDVAVVPANQLVLLLMPEKHHEVKRALYSNASDKESDSPEAKHFEWINSFGFRVGNKMAGHKVRNRAYKIAEQLTQQRQELKSAVLGENSIVEQWQKRKQREYLKKQAMNVIFDKSANERASDKKRGDSVYCDCMDIDTGLENDPALENVNRIWDEGGDDEGEEDDKEDNDPEILEKISAFASGTLYTRQKKSQKKSVVRKYVGKRNTGGRSSLKITLRNGFGSKNYEKVLTWKKQVIDQHTKRRRRTVQRSTIIKNIKYALFSATHKGVSPYALSIDNLSVDAIPEEIFVPLHRAYIHVPR